MLKELWLPESSTFFTGIPSLSDLDCTLLCFVYQFLRQIVLMVRILESMRCDDLMMCYDSSIREGYNLYEKVGNHLPS